MSDDPELDELYRTLIRGYDALWEALRASAVQAVVEQQPLNGFFTIFCRNGEQKYQRIAWRPGDIEDKQRHLHLLRLRCIAEDALAVSCISEAWLAVSAEPGTQAIQSDRREEVLVVSMVGKIEGRDELYRKLSTRRILRGGDGRVIGVEDKDVLGDGDAESTHSPIMHLLPEWKPTAADRRRARAETERLLKRMRRGKF